MNAAKLRTYLGDALLLAGAGFVFVQQGTSKDPKIEVMVLCIVVLTGRTAVALRTWLGGSDGQESSRSSEPSESSQAPPPPS